MSARTFVLLAAASVAFCGLTVRGAGAQTAPPAIPDSLYERARRLVEEGDGARGRALVDSLLRLTRDGSPQRANALFWRASLAADTPSAQRDYLLITVDYALTPRAADALLRLAQIDLTAGNRAGARQRLERLVLEHPTTTASAEGWFYLGVVRRDEGDLANGCAALDSARTRLSAGDVERRNRVDFEAQRCRTLPQQSAPPPTPPGAPPGALPVRVPPPDTVKPPTGPQWSVQVAAFRTQAEGDALARTLRARGYEPRVVHLEPYFRVRIGMFNTRQEAAALVTRLRAERTEAIVVEAERRGS